MSRFRARPRKNGYDIDVKAPDGYLLGGWRKICRGGFVRFAGSRWRHPDMEAREGEYVFVHVDCYLSTEASFAFEDEPRRKWYGPSGLSDHGRRPMICDDWNDDQKIEADAQSWYSQAQLEEIARQDAAK